MNDMTHINKERFIYKEPTKTAMERRLIPQGQGGFTIYLPKKWVEKKALKAGDTVNITETDTALIVGSPVKERKEITLIITSDNKKDLRHLLTHIYRRGFDVINVKNLTPQLLKDVRKEVRDVLLGFEVTEKNDEYVKIENISEPTEQKYDILIRRIFLIIKETQQQTNFKEIDELRNNIDKYILFCRRLLTKEKYERNIALEWEMLTFLMHFQHGYYYLHKYAKENKVKFNKDINDLLKELEKYFDHYYNAYFKKDIKHIHKLWSHQPQYAACYKALEKSKGKQTIILSHIREIFRLIQIGASPILSSLIQS